MAGWRVSKTVRHVVKHIVKPAGLPIEERPPIPTEEERVAKRDAAKAAKDQRRAFARAAERLDGGVQKTLRITKNLLDEGRKASSGWKALAGKALEAKARRKKPVLREVVPPPVRSSPVRSSPVQSIDPYGWGLHQKLSRKD